MPLLGDKTNPKSGRQSRQSNQLKHQRNREMMEIMPLASVAGKKLPDIKASFSHHDALFSCLLTSVGHRNAFAVTKSSHKGVIAMRDS